MAAQTGFRIIGDMVRLEPIEDSESEVESRSCESRPHNSRSGLASGARSLCEPFF